jgi:uroporphyrinogen decarboxylase
MTLSSRERLLAALDRRTPDRLPATTHHLMPSFLAAHAIEGDMAFFDRFGLDAICWTTPLKAQPENGGPGWRLEREDLADPDYRTTRFRFITPRGALSMLVQDDGRTTWVRERLLRRKRDIEILEAIVLAPECDLASVESAAAATGDRGLVRGAVPGFPVYGQPGCWQDAAVLFGIEPLILATFSDPGWVEALLSIVQRPKLHFLRSAVGARFDLVELGGGDASSTVISPPIFDRFVAPFDEPLVAAAHDAGLRVVYHTCGGMMPFLERIAGMAPDAMETFTPGGMGGDARMAEAKARIGDRVCLIGGFDQVNGFAGCTPDDTRAAVRRLFDEAGRGGGYILAPSDHFFDADPALIDAFADEARRCLYGVTGAAGLKPCC